MTVHLLRASAMAVVILLITALPFLPGSYDPLAVSLSTLARVFGVAALLLLPLGILWIASSLRRPPVSRDFALARGALVIWALIWGLLSLAATACNGWSLGLLCLTLSAHGIRRLRFRLPAFKEGPPLPVSVPAVYLVVLPLAVVLLQQPVVRGGAEYSRHRAIRHAAPMIAAIERHRADRHTFPSSLLSVWGDYPTGVIGIERFHYEPRGAAYNLVFENPAAAIGTREFVVYNPLDEQVATSHRIDILEFSPEHLEQTRGYYAVWPATQPHWKYFWFD